MEKENILLVEGPDDRSAITGLMDKHHVVRNFEFVIATGIDNLLQKLDLYLKNAAAYGIIGVVVDADKNVDARWQQLRDRLMKTGKYSCKKMPLAEEGMIVEADEPEQDAKVGIWIMPDNKYQGTLENFLLEMVPENDELMEEVENELVRLETNKVKRYRDIDRNKAKVHTFLAWEENPGTSLYTAVVSRILNPDADIAKLFMDWMKRLYQI